MEHKKILQLFLSLALYFATAAERRALDFSNQMGGDSLFEGVIQFVCSFVLWLQDYFWL